MHEAFESYKFHLWKQEPTENTETYVGALCQLEKNCILGQLRDRLIRDQIVVGVRDDCIREKLLSDKQLTPNKCLQIDRTHETSKQQTKAISLSVDTDEQINRVNKNSNKRYPNKNKTEKKCIRCGKFPAHNRNDCPAINVRCWQCSEIGHYARVCKSKSELGSLKRTIFWVQLSWIKLIQSNE